MVTSATTKAVVLARGLGSRMRGSSDLAGLDAATRQAALAGAKAMIPLHGRPFVDYVLQSLLDAGLRELCLVVAPGPGLLREHIERLAAPAGAAVDLRFAEQAEPRGTADAVLAAEAFAAGDSFLMVNGDNLYPPAALAALRATPSPALVAFSREGLARGNIAPERIAAFAVMDVGADGKLQRIIEKPSDPAAFARGGHVWVSMNCWHFPAAIFEACRRIEPHPVRGEYELPAAVAYGVQHLGLSFQAVPCDEPVLDLTRAEDIADVAARVAGIRITLPRVEGPRP